MAKDGDALQHLHPAAGLLQLLQGRPAVADAHHHGGDVVLPATLVGQRHHHLRMIALATHRGAIFAVKRNIKNASAEFSRHLGLELQALAHPLLDAAVVITDRQKRRRSLGTEKDFAWMFHEMLVTP